MAEVDAGSDARRAPDGPGTTVPESLVREAMAAHGAGRLADAARLYERIAATQPDHFDALHGLGVIAVQQGRLEAARELLARALVSNPHSAAAYANQFVVLQRLGRFDEALASCEQALALDPRHPDALHNRGIAHAALGRYDAALASYDQALAVRPAFAPTHYNRGLALAAAGRFDVALASYEQALALAPASAEAWYNRGVALAALERHAEALASYDQALARQSGFAAAWNNRGNALHALRRFDEALSSYDRALALAPEFADALYNRGLARAYLRRHAAACDDLERALAQRPDLPYGAGMLFHSRMQCCDWREHATAAQRIVAAVRDDARAADPLTLLGITDSAADQLRCAQTWVRDRCPPSVTPLWNGERYRHDRIRLAYLSADLRDHAVAHLAAGLFERHDRARFSTLAVAFGAADASPMRARLEAAFERFVDAGQRTDQDVAELLRREEIDVAVDLGGFTADSRTGIFARRPAPIQVNYLGFPATMGAPYIDYIVADRVVIPQTRQACYAERVVYLPESFQPNDARRDIAPTPSRMDVGLPERGFVFCAFNNSYKLTPAMFDVWMRLLRRIPESVLWLLGGSDVVVANLQREAGARGVTSDRLVFAPRLPYPAHLARYRLADLFLDTLPFNGGTTASDALWAGLPVLTASGDAFAARMAASLLHTIGLSELATASLGDYEALAIRLATDGAALAALRGRLQEGIRRAPLFDAERSCRLVEAAYTAMVERQRQGLTPVSLAVPPTATPAGRP